MTKLAGVNGFGRFGLHFLKYWLDRNQDANFQIGFINDDTLSLKDAFRIITSDPHVVFNKYKVQLSELGLVILEPNGAKHDIVYTNAAIDDIPWVGKPELFCECSGKKTVATDCQPFLKEKTHTVVISATSWDAEKTFVYGFNHDQMDPEKDKIFSYGSCTVNAFVPLAHYINNKYGVIDSDVNCVHNIAGYKLKDFNTLNRKFCTLEKRGPDLLPFLQNNNFHVNYTVVPFDGVSMIDFRFRVESVVDREKVIADLEEATAKGALAGLYDLNEIDIGPEVNNCTTYSCVFIKEATFVKNNNIYLHGYFDTENSVNRCYEIVRHLLSKQC